MVSCHPMLTCCAHEPSPPCVPGTHCCAVRKGTTPLNPSCGRTPHRLHAPHYAHSSGIPSSHFSHAHLASVSSSAEQGCS